MRVKLSDQVPIGEIWFIDSKKMIRTRIKDVDSFIDIDPTKTIDSPTGFPDPDFSGLLELDQFKAQLKSNIDLMLQEKTGWGRVELLRRLVDLIDETGESELDEEVCKIDFKDDLPF